MDDKTQKTIEQLINKKVLINCISSDQIIVRLADTLDELVKVGEEIAKDPKVDLKSDRRILLYNAIIKGGGNLFY